MAHTQCFQTVFRSFRVGFNHVRSLHRSTLMYTSPYPQKPPTALMLQQASDIEKKTMYFDEIKKDLRNKQTFRAAVQGFVQKDIRRAGHVDFIYAALKRLKAFGVHKDLDVYKDILNVFPKGRFIAQNMWQVEFMHYPRQQECCIDVLQEMEMNAVVPDVETYHIILNAFGDRSIAMRKFKRIMYWFPKFRHANPYAVSLPLPHDPSAQARLALERMCPDVTKEVHVFQTAELPEAHDRTWIASLICPAQRDLIAKIPSERSVYVEGEFSVFLRDQLFKYFVLRDEPDNLLEGKVTPEPYYDKDCAIDWDFFWEKENPKEYAPLPSIHEQEDGKILSLCITGSSSKDSVRSWITFLSRTNPRLIEVPVVFRIRTLESDTELLNVEDQVPKSSMAAAS